MNNPEKSVEHLSTPDFPAERIYRSIEDPRWSSYEDNRSDTSTPERYRLRHENVHNVYEAKFATLCTLNDENNLTLFATQSISSAGSSRLDSVDCVSNTSPSFVHIPNRCHL